MNVSTLDVRKPVCSFIYKAKVIRAPNNMSRWLTAMANYLCNMGCETCSSDEN